MAKRTAVQNSSKTKKSRGSAKKEEERPPIPVTILSGFLGSGKTTLLKNILTSKEHNLKIAVIVNDMAELNIDGQTISRVDTVTSANDNDGSTSGIIKTKREVVTLENGCICCTLRGDLIREINRIQELKQFDYVLIESTGIAEPQQVAESFCVDPETQTLVSAEQDPNKMLWNAARLDTCVTVVDVVNFPRYLSSLKRFQDVFQDGLDEAEEEEGKKSISELMVEQVEFANVILLNKIDLVTPKKVEICKNLVESLNPKARVVTGSYGTMDLTKILNTHLFNMEEAEQSSGWLVSLQDGVDASVGEADEYGVSSFVYRARKPFHPQRLHSFLQQFFCFAEDWQELVLEQDNKEEPQELEVTPTGPNSKNLKETYGSILRSKGTCWIAGRDDHEIGWAQAGRIIQLSPTAPWYCKTPRDEWDGVETEEDADRIEETTIKPHEFGDRRQEIVFIGTELQQAAIETELERCLLTKVEMKDHNVTSLPTGTYPDPLHPILVPCDSPQSIFLIARSGQSQHIRIFPRFSLTISNLALNMDCYDDSVRAVKVWLDRSDNTQQGVLLATLRPNNREQHAMSLTLLPCDEVGGEVAVNRRLRVAIIHEKTHRGLKRVPYDLMNALEVHVMGKVEPIPYNEDSEEDEEGESDMEAEEECETGICQ